MMTLLHAILMFYLALPLVLTVVGAVRELCMPLVKLVRRQP